MEKGLYENYIKPHLGKIQIGEMKRKNFQELFLHLSQREKLSNERVNRIRTLLHCMFNQAVLWELVEVNPVSGTRPLPQKQYTKEEVINYLSQAEAIILLDWMEKNDPWLYSKTRLLLNTGMRFGEMVALRISDLVTTPEGGRLFVARSYCRHSMQIRNRTKGRKSRVIPLGMGMTRFLREVAAFKKPDEPLLWDSWDEPKYPTKFNKHFKKALKESGVRRIRVHDMRHTFAVHFLERGGQLYDLQKLLGHHSVRLTERYSHFSVAMTERSRGLVDHHARPSIPPPLAVIDGGVRSAMSHKCPTNSKTAGENATDSVAST